jgi:hypothetical protein
LRELGATVNQTCGLHVHFDYSFVHSEMAVREIGKRLGRYLPILSKLVPASRRNNRYCALEVSGLAGDRYYAINLTSFRKHQTIEVRLHSGTIDAVKIENWIRLLHLIQAKNTPRRAVQVETVQDLIDELGLPDSLAEYVDERFNKFNDEPTATATTSTSTQASEVARV